MTKKWYLRDFMETIYNYKRAVTESEREKILSEKATNLEVKEEGVEWIIKLHELAKLGQLDPSGDKDIIDRQIKCALAGFAVEIIEIQSHIVSEFEQRKQIEKVRDIYLPFFRKLNV